MADINQLLNELEDAWQPRTSRRKRQASDVIHDLIVETKKLPMKDGEN